MFSREGIPTEVVYVDTLHISNSGVKDLHAVIMQLVSDRQMDPRAAFTPGQKRPGRPFLVDLRRRGEVCFVIMDRLCKQVRYRRRLEMTLASGAKTGTFMPVGSIGAAASNQTGFSTEVYVDTMHTPSTEVKFLRAANMQFVSYPQVVSGV